MLSAQWQPYQSSLHHRTTTLWRDDGVRVVDIIDQLPVSPMVYELVIQTFRKYG